MTGTCDNCRYAEWRRTSNGRLHPDKSGVCGYLKEHPLDLRLPSAFYWYPTPSASGGSIARGKLAHRPTCIFKDGSAQ